MKLFWDTNLFIYLWDTNDELHELAKSLHIRVIATKDAIITSTLALGELQVGPKKSGDEALALRYKSAISQSATVVSFDEAAADTYTYVRQKTNAKGPDAIHLACGRGALS